jgi:hypothetical protein
MFWLVLLVAWTAIAVVAGLVLGAAVRTARQMQGRDPYAGVLMPERPSPLAR